MPVWRVVPLAWCPYTVSSTAVQYKSKVSDVAMYGFTGFIYHFIKTRRFMQCLTKSRLGSGLWALMMCGSCFQTGQTVHK